MPGEILKGRIGKSVEINPHKRSVCDYELLFSSCQENEKIGQTPLNTVRVTIEYGVIKNARSGYQGQLGKNQGIVQGAFLHRWNRPVERGRFEIIARRLLRFDERHSRRFG